MFIFKKNCLVCNREIIKSPTRSLKDWENRTKYCSKKCSGTASLPDRTGKNPTQESKEKMSQSRIGFIVVS